jgi:hypothetical protein
VVRAWRVLDAVTSSFSTSTITTSHSFRNEKVACPPPSASRPVSFRVTFKPEPTQPLEKLPASSPTTSNTPAHRVVSLENRSLIPHYGQRRSPKNSSNKPYRGQGVKRLTALIYYIGLSFLSRARAPAGHNALSLYITRIPKAVFTAPGSISRHSTSGAQIPA